MRLVKFLLSDDLRIEAECDHMVEINDMIRLCKKKGVMLLVTQTDGKIQLINPDHIIAIEEL